MNRVTELRGRSRRLVPLLVTCWLSSVILGGVAGYAVGRRESRKLQERHLLELKVEREDAKRIQRNMRKAALMFAGDANERRAISRAMESAVKL